MEDKILRFTKEELEKQVQVQTHELEEHNRKLLNEIAEREKFEEPTPNMAVFPE